MDAVYLTILCMLGVIRGEILKNGNFESTSDWHCYDGITCAMTSTRIQGHYAMNVTNRKQNYNGPNQYIDVKVGKLYDVSGYVKLLNDEPGPMSQRVIIGVGFHLKDGSDVYTTAATHEPITTHNGWTQLQGELYVPENTVKTHIYFGGPVPEVSFLADKASITESNVNVNMSDTSWRHATDSVIRSKRMSDIRVQVNTGSHINKNDVQIQILQKKKSFPFGSEVAAPVYNNASQKNYRDFIGKHFNWAVPGNALKWYHTEWREDHLNYHDALDLIHGLKSQGLKVRGHNLVWSVEKFVPSWQKSMSASELQQKVKHHIEEIMDKTRGLLEHWDVNNENLHGTWYQDKVGDPNYNLELFRIAHHADPNVKLFLNDYQVVAGGAMTKPYLAQALKFKAANVGLYGLGVQCHFSNEVSPNPWLIKRHLDLLAQAGLPIWVTELDVVAADENKRADFYERALRALYGHPAVEGILFWGFWDGKHWRGENAAFVDGADFKLNAAGRRILDLFENQWMTDETHVLSHPGTNFTVRGFHGDYEAHVRYQGHERGDLKQTFTLSPGHTHTVKIDLNN